MNTYKNIEELPLTIRIDDLMAVLGIGKNTAYNLVHCSAIKHIRVGRQIRIPRSALLEYMNSSQT